MTTALETITGALRLLGVAETGQALSADDVAVGLQVLNEMLDDWSTHNLVVFTAQDQTFALVSGVATYTIGATGSWVGSRPTQIIEARVTYQSIDYPVDVVGNSQFNAIPYKSQQGVIPSVLSYNGTVPNGTVSVWPVPTTSSSIVITGNQQFAQLASIGTTLVLPPGYARALRFNLARDLAEEYGKQLTPESLRIAATSLGNIKRANIVPDEAEFDPMFTSDGGTEFGMAVIGNSGIFNGGSA